MNSVNENQTNNTRLATSCKSPAPGLLKLKARDMAEEPSLLDDKTNALSPTATEETVQSPVNKKLECDTNSADDLSIGEEDHHHDAGEHAHPSLDALLVLDKDNHNQRIHPNGQLVKIDNEWLDMEMLIMLRTPNVDDDTCDPGTARNQAICKHFLGKQRRFEFQYQGKIKKKPEGKGVYFCMELAKSPKLNFLQKALVTTCMAFMKKMSPSFHFNMETKQHENKMKEGAYETPHMAFEVERVLDRLTITKPGETPPVLGETISEDPERVKSRKEGKFKVDWNTEDIYTMTIWSHYIDWLKWEVVHIPGVKHFSMSNVLGDCSVFMQLYLLDKHRKEKNKHYQKDLQHVVNLEFKPNPDFVKVTTTTTEKSHHNNKKHKKKLFGK